MTWHASTSQWYTPNSQEAIDNATEAYSILIPQYGWTEAACAGMFGNIDHEGMWNPWSWQGSGSPAAGALTQSYAESITREQGAMVHGYGLIGWTPAKKYQFNNAVWNGVVLFPNYDQESYPGYGPFWSDVPGNPNDGAAQIKLIGEAMANGSPNIWLRRSGEPHNISASDFIALTDPEEAALCWLWRAERPSSIFDDRRARTERVRKKSAVDWMDRLDWQYSTKPKIWMISKKWYRL